MTRDTRRWFFLVPFLLFTPGVAGAEDSAPPLPGKLLYSRFTDWTWQIWQTDLDTHTRSQLTFSAGDKRKPAWTPDGRVGYHTTNHGYYLLPLASQEGEPFLSRLWPITDVAWAPDGPTVVFSKLQVELVDHANLWVADSSGETPRVLTHEAGLQDEAAWAPDGRHIAYIGGQGVGLSELYRINADGSGQIQLTTNQTRELSPAWSPDGTTIALVSDASGDYEIWVMQADGAGLTQLTNSPGLDASPAWSPDGRYIAFTTNRSGVLEIWVMSADGTDQRLVEHADGGVCDPAWR
jgi:TolB protein